MSLAAAAARSVAGKVGFASWDLPKELRLFVIEEKLKLLRCYWCTSNGDSDYIQLEDCIHNIKCNFMCTFENVDF